MSDPTQPETPSDEPILSASVLPFVQPSRCSEPLLCTVPTCAEGIDKRPHVDHLRVCRDHFLAWRDSLERQQWRNTVRRDPDHPEAKYEHHLAIFKMRRGRL